MIFKKSIKRYITQITALVEKDIFLELRIKSSFFLRFINPLIQLLVLFFIFGIIFSIKEGFNIGYWNAENYTLFLLISFNIQFSRSIINRFNTLFTSEKYWKTLNAIMIAPINRFILLLGTLISELVINSVPILFLLIIAFIFFPISIIYLLIFLFVLILTYLIFSSIGLIIGAFSMSNENILPYLEIVLRFAFIFSCISYPKEIFPQIIQFFVMLNPLYYLFDLLRLTWYLGIDYKIAITNITSTHIIIVIILVISFPLISFYSFEKIYKKYGITGY